MARFLIDPSALLSFAPRHLAVAIPMALGAAACGEASTTTAPIVTGGDEALPPSAAWPTSFVSTAGSGAALYLSDAQDAPAIGFIRPGVDLEVAEGPRNGRALVRIRGDLKVRAWIVTSRLGMVVQTRGKIGGTEVYVGPGDIVRYLGSGDEPGLVRVEAMARLTEDVLAPAMEGIYPSDRLAPTAPPADAEAPTPGTPGRLPAGREVALYNRPGGDVIATLPALDPGIPVEVVRDGEQWRGVRVGVGPYLVGYIDVAPVPSERYVAPAAAADAVPAALMTAAEASRPLWRIPAGTRVKWDGQTIAIVDAPCYARELERFDDGAVDVFVASQQLSIRGLVPAESLEAVPQ
ncbi:MAG: hypothetical protein KF901_13500 [Myxococcales bacterium]|nr:hypothetical protein [Myxococcales bacterium]